MGARDPRCQGSNNPPYLHGYCGTILATKNLARFLLLKTWHDSCLNNFQPKNKNSIK